MPALEKRIQDCSVTVAARKEIADEADAIGGPQRVTNTLVQEADLQVAPAGIVN